MGRKKRRKKKHHTDEVSLLVRLTVRPTSVVIWVAAGVASLPVTALVIR